MDGSTTGGGAAGSNPDSIVVSIVSIICIVQIMGRQGQRIRKAIVTTTATRGGVTNTQNRKTGTKAINSSATGSPAGQVVRSSTGIDSRSGTNAGPTAKASNGPIWAKQVPNVTGQEREGEGQGQTQLISNYGYYKEHAYHNYVNCKIVYILIIGLVSLSVTLAQSRSFVPPSAPQQYTIFDEIGQMAAGMAHIHVAIPLNLTTFTDQADILADYLSKLSKVVDPDNPEKESFMQNIREIAVFGSTRLNRIRKQILHLDIILPVDGDLTTNGRNRRTVETDFDEDEEIIYEKYSEVHKTVIRDNSIHINSLFQDPSSLKNNFTLRTLARIKEVLHFHSMIKHHSNKTKHHLSHKFKLVRPKRAIFRKELPTFQGQMFKPINFEFGEERHEIEVRELNWLRLKVNASLYDTFEESKKILKQLQELKTDKILERKMNPATGILNVLAQDISKAEEDIKTDTIRQKRHTSKLRRQRRHITQFLTKEEREIYRLMNTRENLQLFIMQQLLQLVNEVKFQQNLQLKLATARNVVREKPKSKMKEFFTLDEIFASIPNSTDFTVGKRVKRVAPLVAFGAISGVLGTFLGMYSAYEVTQLKMRLNQQGKNHNLLVHVTKKQEERIHRITENMNAIVQLIKMMVDFNPALIAAQLGAQLDLFESRLSRATGAVQQLQHRRLSIDLLDTLQMTEMHRSIEEVASARGYVLMPERLSDYFQLEASYLRQGEDILIMLHVPCINKDQMLTIYKYIPFPYPLPAAIDQENITIAEMLSKRVGEFNLAKHNTRSDQTIDSLIIIPEAEMIAVGRNDRYKILTQGDLDNCIKRNRVYLCERNQVLHTNLANSCLGSIYTRDETGVRNNCKLERKKLRETVYQLSATDHLLFTPVPYNTRIDCKNGSHFPIYLAQTTQLHVPEECSIILKSHSIQSDYNMRISPEPLHIPWQWDPLTLPADLLLDAALIDRKIHTVSSDLAKLLNETGTKTDFHNMLNDRFYDPTSFPWFVWVSILASIAALLLLIFWYCYNLRQQRQYQQIAQPPIQLINIPQQPSQSPPPPPPPTAPKPNDNLYPNMMEHPPTYGQ